MFMGIALALVLGQSLSFASGATSDSLMEDGFFTLLEDGGKSLLEDSGE